MVIFESNTVAVSKARVTSRCGEYAKDDMKRDNNRSKDA